MNSGLYAKESNKFMMQGKVTQYSYKHYTLYNQRKCTQKCLISYYYVEHTTALNYKPNKFQPQLLTFDWQFAFNLIDSCFMRKSILM